jgi:hypothetical protein
MAPTPKSISVKDLSGAVHTAVAGLKMKPPPEAGPFVYINPGIICGLIYIGPLAEFTGAQQIAASIAGHVSKETGVPVAPIVQEGVPGTPGAQKAFPLRHIIMGYKPDPNFNVRF